jgi:lipooligosaccharide transport system permease protein
MATPGAVRVASWHAAVFRRMWTTNALSSLIQPLLYMLGLGVGVGSLVDRTQRSTDVLGGASYVAYVAPALMVTTAMTLAAAESLWPIMGGFVWQRSYYGIAATPLGARDIVGGHGLFMAVRCIVASSAVGIVLALFPDARDWGLIAVVFVAALTGVSFAMPLMAFSSLPRHDQGFAAINRFLIIPLFLFGGAFYPVSQLPAWVQVPVKILPLWHGVELARAATLGGLSGASIGVHLAVLIAWALVGTVVAVRLFARRLYL